MKLKSSVAGTIIAAALFAVSGSLYAGCYMHTPGWHMVSKRCDIKPAQNWQEYTSGVYLQPMVKPLM